MKAYTKACNYYYDAVIDKKDPKKFDEVISIIAKYVNAPVEDIKLGLPYIDRDGKLLDSDITTQINWYQANGLLNGSLKTEQIVNNQFLEKALAK